MDGDGGNKSEADQLLITSEKLLASSDFEEAKKIAILACKADPSRTHAADYILAISDTLLAGDSKPLNWYAILRLINQTQNQEHISIQYRRLSLLLDPKVNHLPFAEQALKLVSDAWCVLSDPHKKSIYDQELQSPLQNRTDDVVDMDTSFWTACPYCYVLFEYVKAYEECVLKCQCCGRAFEAIKMQKPPLKSDGEEEEEESVYFCSWGLYPLGCLDYAKAKSSVWSPISQLFVCPVQRSDQEEDVKAPTGSYHDGDGCVVISDDDDDDDDDMYVVISDDD